MVWNWGQDDDVGKPFSPGEVVARVKAGLRPDVPKPVLEKLTVGPINLDEKKHQVQIEGQALKLTPNEFSLFKILLAHPDL